MQYYSTRFEKPQDGGIQSGKPCPWSSYFWSPMIGEQLFCEIEDSSAQDVYAGKVIHGATVVHHVPRKISLANMLFWRKDYLVHHQWKYNVGTTPQTLQQNGQFTSIKVPYAVNFGGWLLNCHIAKLKSSPNFPGIRYFQSKNSLHKCQSAVSYN